MSDRERTAKSNETDSFDDELESVFQESGEELDALLEELGSESGALDEERDSLLASDVGDDDFDELVSLPEVDEELDLSIGDVPAIDEEYEQVHAELEPVEEFQAEPEQPVVESTEKSMNNDPLAEVAAIAAERNAEAAKMQGGAGGRMVQLVMAGVALLALAAAIFAAWQASSSASRVNELAAALQALQQRNPSTSADQGAVGEELERLMAQVNEMAATLDGSLVELREKNETALAAVQVRLDKLEQAQASTPVATIKPMLEKVAAITPTTTAGGGWSVNLISLSNEKDAEQELLRLRNLGIRAERQQVEQDGRVWFRLRVPGFTSHDGARAYIATVENKAGVKNAWVGRD